MNDFTTPEMNDRDNLLAAIATLTDERDDAQRQVQSLTAQRLAEIEQARKGLEYTRAVIRQKTGEWEAVENYLRDAKAEGEDVVDIDEMAEALGITLAREFAIEFTVTYIKEVTVEALSEDDAREKFENGQVDWSIETHYDEPDETEIARIYEA